MAGQDVLDAIISILIIIFIFILGYCAITKKTMKELFQELKDMIVGVKEDTVK